MSTFQREHRYCVLKFKDIHEFLSTEQQDALDDICRAVNLGRLLQGRGLLEGVFVENDWPEAETVWNMIEERMCSEKEQQR